MNLSTGSAVVSFPFMPLGGGVLTLVASVQSVQGETNLVNNSMSRRVKATASFKLVAFLNGNPTPIPDRGGELTLAPSVKACGQIPASENGDTDIEIRCVQVGDPALLPVHGCKFFLDLSQGPDTGGHNHNLYDETRPFVLDPFASSFPLRQFLAVDKAGNGITYSPPEVAGDVFFEVTGTDPSGNQISGPSYLFHIKDETLGKMESLNGLGAGLGPSGNNPGISIVANSHPGDGIFGTDAMQTAVSDMVAEYFRLGDIAGFTNLDPLRSEAATLQKGGLFDANWNGAIIPSLLTPWSPPHCGHRNGVTIDLSINQLDPDERKWLAKAAKTAGFVFTSPGERPQDISANHWHAVLKGQ